MAFGPLTGQTRSKPTLMLPMFTDNQSNGFTLNKMMTTKFPPLCAVVMEKMDRLGTRLELRWVLDDMIASGDEFQADRQVKRTWARKRKQRRERLRDREPW